MPLTPLFPAALGVLSAMVACCFASCLASCFITCLSILFACLAVSSMHLPREVDAVGVSGVVFANNGNSPSKSGGSAFCVVVTSAKGTFCMPLGGKPVQSQKRMVHRTEYTKRIDTIFKFRRVQRQVAGNTNSMGRAGSTSTFINATTNWYNRRKMEAHYA